ncbi:MAG TPA: glycosyltransferase family 4 protein [Gemmatimonadales bacterium]
MPEPPRVLHVVPALFSQAGGILGGAERYAHELARHMAASVPTTLLSFGPAARTETDGPLTIRVLGDPWYVRGQRTNPVARGLVRVVGEFDVIHCHQQHVLASTVLSVAARLRGRRVFVSDLGGGGWDVSSYLSTDRLYHGHLHISEYSRRVNGHTTRANAHVIYGGIDIEKFAPPGDGRTRAGAVFVGRWLPHKGLNYLVEGTPPAMPLEIIGQAYHERFAADVRRLAAGKAIRFREDCDDEALVAAYRRAACVVLPSVYRDLYGQETRVPELLGQTLLEGMACGAVPVCTDVASMPEIVTDGQNGFVVPPNDASALGDRLTWIAAHPDEAAALGAAARRTVEQRFTWPQVVDRCLRIYAGDRA